MLKAWKNVYQRKSNNVQQSEKDNTEKENTKDCIIEDVGRAIKLLLQFGLTNSAVKSGCWVSNDLCQRLDEALRHGLRQPSTGYWPFARIFTHANNVKLLENSKPKRNTFDRGRAWLCHSLNEGSLESYLQAFFYESAAIRKHYKRDALIRDSSRRDILLGLLASLREIQFDLSLDVVVTSVTPLPSPEDSGVALLDSDLSETFDSLLDDQDDDTATLNELEDNRINRLLSLEIDTTGKSVAPCNPHIKEQEEKLSTKKDDNIILRTPKKSVNDCNRHLKRVSFHEECFSQTDFSVSFVAPGSAAVLKKDTVKGRYSWCAGGDAPFVVCDTEPKTNSLCLLKLDCAERRGEDIRNYVESTQIKSQELNIKRQILRKHCKSKRLLYWPGMKPNLQACQQLIQEIDYEYECNKKVNVEMSPISGATLILLAAKVFYSSKENVYRVYKGHGPLMKSEISPLWVILSNAAIYVIGSKCGSFESYFGIEYKNLEAVLLGADGQTLHFSSKNKESILLAMDSSETSCDLISRIELSMRKLGLPLPFWRWLSLEDMKLLWHSLTKMVPSLQGERLLHYCIVHVQDETKPALPPSTSKEGLLMMRIGRAGSWIPAFLGLRETELWVFGDEVEREPQLVLSLVRCQGCHRSPVTDRPHTFEIICGPGSTPVQLAAADEYEVSEWLQALLQASSSTSDNFTDTSTNKVQLCGLVLSTGHLLTYNLDQDIPQLVCCNALLHLTALRIVSPASNWCVLEFECTEVHNSSGDLILYFSSQGSRARFCSQLEAIWQTFSEHPLPVTCVVQESLQNRFKETNLLLQSSWDPLLNVNID